MYNDLLPIGSVVLLKGAEKRLMIIGRVTLRDGEDTIYDYAGCYYPQGIINSQELFFFNRDAIEDIFFIGFQDKEEMEFRHNVLGSLGELEVVDGSIVTKEIK